MSDVKVEDKGDTSSSYSEGYGGATFAEAIWNQFDADTLCDRG